MSIERLLRDLHDFKTVAVAARYLTDDEELSTKMAWMFRTHLFDHLPEAHELRFLQAIHTRTEELDPVGWTTGHVDRGLMWVMTNEMLQMVHTATLRLRPGDLRVIAKLEARQLEADELARGHDMLFIMWELARSLMDERQQTVFDDKTRTLPWIMAVVDRERWRRARNSNPIQEPDGCPQ